MKLELCGVDCGYRDRTVLRGLSFTVSSSEIVCLLGPNGVGKTTLFKTVLGFLKLQGGKILADGEDVRTWSRKKYARTIGYVPQSHTPPFPFTVFDVVAMGRTAYLDAFASPSQKDLDIAEEALEALEITHLRDRIYTEISGGERQMVLIARALAQQPRLLVMDEPTSNLDFGNQMRVLAQIKRLAEKGMAAINCWYNAPEKLAAFCGGEGGDSFQTRAEQARGKRVTVVGRFPNLEEQLGPVCQLSVLERNPEQGDYPDSACEFILPEQEMVFITGMGTSSPRIS